MLSVLVRDYRMTFKTVFVVINPASGNNEPILNTLNDVFQQHDVTWQVGITFADGDGAKYAKQAVADGYDLVMAYGGDGTVLDVAIGLMGTSTPLAILAGGTANAMASEMGVSDQLEKAVRLPFADDSMLRAVDIGQVNDTYFLLRIGTGMIATFSESVTRDLKNQYGVAAYFLGGIKALQNPQTVTYKLNIDGEAIETTGTACLITNGNELGVLNLKLSPKVDISDGLLDVFIINNDVQSIIGMVSTIAQIDNDALKLQHWQGRNITIDTEPAQSIYGDGETVAFTETPCEIHLHPQAIQIVTSGKKGKK